MAFKNIREFAAELEKRGELARIRREVNPELEITEIYDRVVKRGGPALLFENVTGSAFPVLINAFGTERRMALALGAENLRELTKRMENLLSVSVKSVPEALRVFSAPPALSLSAPCREVVSDADFSKLPILKCWEKDGGRFVTLPLVFTKDPETGSRNCGMYRMQIYDKNTAGMHWHKHKDGANIYEKYKNLGIKRMPVSVAVGCDPATVYAATAPLPPGIDELMFAGFLRRRPVPVVKSLTNNIRIPANAEFVIEGYVDTSEPLRIEGPFGDHTGYYSEKDLYPVFHAEKITHARDAVYAATVVGKPPMEDCFLAKATERLFLPVLRVLLPEIVDMNLPVEGVFHNCAIVSIDKKYPGHAAKVCSALWGTGQMMYTKLIVVVDKDVDTANLSEVAWRVFNNIDAGRDLILSEGALDALDHASPHKLRGTRLGIDATRKPELERGWAEDIVMGEDMKAYVTKHWREYWP